MRRLALDTSAYSMLMRGDDTVAALLTGSDEAYLPAVVVGELLAGFRKGGVEQRNMEILRAFLSTPSVEVLPIGEETAGRYAIIFDSLRRAGTPLPTNDIWIAASAMQYGLELVTFDRHFLRVPQVMVQLLG